MANDYNGYRMDHPMNAKEKRVLKFLVSILNLEKPMSVTIKLLKALLEAYNENEVGNYPGRHYL